MKKNNILICAGLLLFASLFAQRQNNPVVSTSNIKYHKTYDAIVVGYGLAGASTAIELNRLDPNLSILILEKMPEQYAGGNSRASGQTILVLDPQKEEREKFKTYIRECNKPNPIPEEYLEWLATEFADQVGWIKDVVAAVDYELGYVGGGDLRWVKVNEFPEFAGSDYNATSAHIRAKGSPGFENAGVWNGFKAAVSKRIAESKGKMTVMYETPAVSLVQNPKTRAVEGVVAQTADGKLINLRAKKGVVLCCGGFENNLQMQRDFHGMDRVYTTGTPGNTGDGVEMLMAAGAQMWHMKNNTQSGGFWTGIKVPDFESSFIRQMTMKSWSWIDIGKDGKRFYDESRDYHRQHQKYLENGSYIDLKHWQILPSHMIFDEKTRQAQPIATPWLSWPITSQGYRWSAKNTAELEKGWLVKADTIEELAVKINREPAVLRATIDEWNKMAEAKTDSVWNRPAGKMAKIDSAPYYAVELVPALVATTGGARRTIRSEVLDWTGKPIAGLYEAGELGSYVSNLYQNGVFLAEAIASGRAAAAAITQKK